MEERFVERIDRALLLIKQKRFRDADKIIFSLLQEEPDNSWLYYILSESLLLQNKPDESLTYINKAISLSPSTGYYFVSRGNVLYTLDKIEEALEDLNTATTLSPEDEESYTLRGIIYIDLKRYSDALEESNRALEIAPECVMALNLRSQALANLEKTSASLEAAQSALKNDPEEHVTYATYGWTLLQTGHYKMAKKILTEAIRLSPDSEYAVTGLKIAIKAIPNPIYQLHLKRAFRSTTLLEKEDEKGNTTTSIYITIGIVCCYLLGLFITRNATRGLAVTLIALITVFVGYVWLMLVIEPISDAVLLLDKQGKYLLSKGEKANATASIICLFIGLIGLIVWLFTSFGEVFGVTAIIGFTTTLPASKIYNNDKISIHKVVLLVLMIISSIGLISTMSMGNSDYVPFITIYCFAFLLHFI